MLQVPRFSTSVRLPKNLVAYLQLASMFILALVGAALGADTNHPPNILWGALPGFLGLCGLLWIHRDAR